MYTKNERKTNICCTEQHTSTTEFQAPNLGQAYIPIECVMFMKYIV